MTIHELLQILQPVIHYGLHLFIPGLIAWIFFRAQWKKAWLIMLATMLVDLDHLFAYPEVFVPGRCGIGFHPFHSYYAIAGYCILAYFPKIRIIAVGLLFHMLTDFQDSLWMVYFNNR
jgi:hypothetical protein